MLLFHKKEVIMQLQIETDLSLEVPDRCGKDCDRRSFGCALAGAVYITRRVFQNIDMIKTLDDATAAKNALDNASEVLRECDTDLHDKGLEPVRSSIDLDGNTSFGRTQSDFYNFVTTTYIPKLAFVNEADIFGKDS